MIRTALLGGSFNPAHSGHRNISLRAAKALRVDELWWLVSPGNPLKPRAGMAPLQARYVSARRMARRSIIRPTAIEQVLKTRYTVDTIRRLRQRYPKRRFIWLMGADNLAQLPDWHDWRRIARLIPIAVIARPGYDASVRARRAMGWLRGFVHPSAKAGDWTEWRTPALVRLRFRPDRSSATAIRRARPDWYQHVSTKPQRDSVSRRLIV